LGLFVLIVFGCGGLQLAYYRIKNDLPALANLRDYERTTKLITKVYDIKGRILAEFYTERRLPLNKEDIPPILANAFIAIEDRRFLEHRGVDYRGIVRAFYHNLLAMEMKEGGSTITQQVARSYYLSREKTFARKIKEALLALQIERNFDKDEIVTIYLNQIYLGHGAYGAGAAADEYFGKHVSKLTLGEMAILAALPKEPALYDPYKHPEKSLSRRNLVLDTMVELGMVNSKQAEAAKAEKISLVSRVDPTRIAAPYFSEYVRQYLEKEYGRDEVYNKGLKVFTTLDADWNNTAQQALKWGLRRLDHNMGWHGPLKHLEGDDFKKFLDDYADKYSKPPALNDIVEAAVTNVPKSAKAYATLRIGRYNARIPEGERGLMKKLNVEPYEKAKIGLKPRSYLETGDIIEVQIQGTDPDGTLVVSLDQTPLVQGSLISIDPYTGEVRAMVGGYDFTKSEFNRAIQAKRQSGSSFKPFIYTAAIDSTYTPASVVNDAPVVLSGGSGEWRPGNYGGKFSGPQTLASALEHSINTISIKLTMDMGVDRVIKYARMMGIESDLPKELSIALGSASLSLEELTRAYGTLASEGRRLQTIYILRVYDRDGKLLEDRTPRAEGFATPPENADDFRKWLAGGKMPMWGSVGYAFRKTVSEHFNQVLDPKTVYVMISMMRNVVEAGTGTNARLPGIEVAGKTGTTNNYRDALFIGFTTQLLTGVWVGYDDPHISLLHGSTGGDLAAPIWARYMLKALSGHVIPEFPRPEGVTTYTFDFITGTYPCPDSKAVGRAAFKDGTQPTECNTLPTQQQDFLQNDLRLQDPPSPQEELPP